MPPMLRELRTTQGSEGESHALPAHPHTVSWPSLPAGSHPRPPKDTPHTGIHPLSPHQVKHSLSYAICPAPSQACRPRAHPGELPGTALEKRASGPPSHTHTGAHRPTPAATHRPPERTAAAGPHRCSRGRPQSGSPCCEWPSCAPVWVSSRDSPGGHGERPNGLPTLAAPFRAPKRVHRQPQTQLCEVR